MAVLSLEVFRTFRLDGKGVGVQAGRGSIMFLRPTDLGQPEPSRAVLGPALTLIERAQLAIQFDQEFGFPDPLGRGVMPIRLLGARS